MSSFTRLAFLRLLTIGLLATGCTVHPNGEHSERDKAIAEGKRYQAPFEMRRIAPLSNNPSPEELVRYALQSNADVEQKYWDWRSAIEQIPQDGTEATNLVLSANIQLMNGSTGWDRTTISAGNDPMADIVLPRKLSIAARRALENARAAGIRFHRAQLELRGRVLAAYYDYAQTAELIRLEQANSQLLKTTAKVAEARNRAGSAGQQDLLKASNEADLSGNDIAAMQADLPTERAAINALLGREPDATIDTPAELPASRSLELSDGDVLTLAARQNPELLALAREIQGKKDGIALAKLQYLPDLSLSVGSDLKGITQSLLGTVTIPYLRHEAIDAAVAQSQANLRSVEAMRRQTANDIRAQVVMDLSLVRDTDRQLQLFDRTILPRARQIVTVARSSYEASQSSLLDLLDSERSLISIQRLVTNLRVTRLKKLADLESVTGVEL